MTSRFTNDPRIRQGPTTENLLRENKVWKSEEDEEKARLNPWRMPSPEEERSPREASKKRMSGSLEEMVAQVVDGGKRRRVGGAFDPENFEGNRVPFMVKIGGVWWEEGIGGVEVALREAGVGFCEGTRWLVGEEELDKRRKVRHFVAVQLKRRVAAWEGVMERVGEKVEGMRKGLEERGKKERSEEIEEGSRVEKVLAALKGLGDRLSMVEGSVKGVAQEVGKFGLSKEERLAEKKEEYMRRMRLREEEREAEKEMEDVADEFFKASKEEFKQGRGNRGGVDFGVKPTGPNGFSFGKAQGNTSFGGRGGNLFDVWKKGS
ncbi:hypothetical protein HOY80DRAFT_1043079 [Tuber brumale]|nr:hypothetical protein HOY80DRAFT_1043079 [Tuber brumale]